MARVAAWWSPAIRELAVPAREREPRAFASLEAYLASKPTQVVPTGTGSTTGTTRSG
jgi:hypothetical protein